MPRQDLPTGTVTFLFSDIEGSTRLLERLKDAYPKVLEDHQRLLREAFTAQDGVEVSTDGDAFFVVFRTPAQAVAAAVAAQRALGGHPWPMEEPLRVRIGIHTGEGQLGGDNYVGYDVHRAARVMAAGHGGQILVSDAARALSVASLPDGMAFRDLGEHRLKDLPSLERISQVLADGLEEEFPELRTEGAHPGTIPEALTSFVGRGPEVEQIKEALGRTRLLTLTGPGGTGKTRLSIRVASEMQGAYPDGTFFVALAPIQEAALVVPTISQVLRVREEAGRAPIDTLVDHLRDKQVLLVLDNLEQVLDAASDVADILAGTSGVRILATSRERLHLHAEQEYPVPPLALPDPANLPSLEAVSQYEAVALFIERARAVRPDFQITNENAPAVAEICARVDGLPLAIELAAARVRLLSPEGILRRLEDRLALLGGGARDLPARQQTLRGAIAWSYDLLDERERRLFSRFSVFRGGANLEAIEAVCGPDVDVEIFDGVASLVDKSLLRQTESVGGEPRFFMLETIRDFAKEHLHDWGDGPENLARHFEHYLAIAESGAPDLFGQKQAELLDLLAREHDNVRAALSWGVEAGRLSEAIRLGAAIWRFWQMRGHLEEGSERLRTLVEHPDAGADPASLAAALEAAGGVAYWRGDWEATERYYQRCLDLRRNLPDRRALAEALYNLGFAYVVPPPPRRDVARGKVCHEEALGIFQELGDQHGVARAYWALASAHEVSSEWEQGREAARQAITLYAEMGDLFGVAWAHHSVGLSSTFLEEFDVAGRALAEALGTFAEGGDLTGIGLLLGDFSILAGKRGDHRRAALLRGAALRIERESGSGLVTNFDWYVEDIPRIVQGDLSDEEFRALLGEGGSMTDQEAIAYALEDGGSE